MHGGLSPDIRTLDQIRLLSRAQEIPHEGGFCGKLRYWLAISDPDIPEDLMWSDPDEVENWAVSPRGAGWLFGGRVTQEFNHFNSLKLIARAHQLVQEGYKFMFDQQLVTVWSAPNYCYRCGNLASILKICEDGSHDFKVYDAAPENERDKGMQRTKRTVRSEPVLQNPYAKSYCLGEHALLCVALYFYYSSLSIYTHETLHTRVKLFSQPPTRRGVPRHVSKTTMANSLVVHGAIFAVGALVGGGIATTIARKNETTSSRGITHPQQPVAPILQVGTTGKAVITSEVGVISPPLKYGNPGAWSPSLCE